MSLSLLGVELHVLRAEAILGDCAIFVENAVEAGHGAGAFEIQVDFPIVRCTARELNRSNTGADHVPLYPVEEALGIGEFDRCLRGSRNQQQRGNQQAASHLLFRVSQIRIGLERKAWIKSQSRPAALRACGRKRDRWRESFRCWEDLRHARWS